jgi:hypothetical protein
VWQRFGEAQFAILGYREEIHVSGRAPDEAESSQRGTTDDHDLNPAAKRLQLIGQRAEQEVNRVISDLHVSECNIQGVEGLQPGCSTSSFRMLAFQLLDLLATRAGVPADQRKATLLDILAAS